MSYRGAMREELLAEQRNNERPVARTQPAVAPAAAPPPSPNGEVWVTPDEMKAQFPDLF